MKKITKIILITVLFLITTSFIGYKVYQFKMTGVLFAIDIIVLQDNENESRTVDINIDSEVEKIFKKAKYTGELAISKDSYYKGKCYFSDGQTGTIIINQRLGDVKILVGDNMKCFTFKDGFGEEWLKLIQSKIDASNK